MLTANVFHSRYDNKSQLVILIQWIVYQGRESKFIKVEQETLGL